MSVWVIVTGLVEFDEMGASFDIRRLANTKQDRNNINNNINMQISVPAIRS